MVSLWGHCGSTWDHFGFTLGSLWCHFRVIVRSLWSRFLIAVGSLWCISATPKKENNRPPPLKRWLVGVETRGQLKITGPWGGQVVDGGRGVDGGADFHEIWTCPVLLLQIWTCPVLLLQTRTCPDSLLPKSGHVQICRPPLILSKTFCF